MNAQELRQHAKDILARLIPGVEHDVDELVDCLIFAAAAELRENHQVYVWNVGYYGVIERKESA